MEQWITDVMSQYGYVGVFLLIAIENLFPPIPSEVILTFGGFMTTYSAMTVPGVIAASTLGSTAGAIVLYFIGYWIDQNRMKRIIEKWGKVLRLTTDDVDKAYGWFSKYGVWTVFFCRMVPLLRSLISIPAGSVRMNFSLFLVLTVIGSLIWNSVLVMLGAAVGASWETIVEVMDTYSNVVYVLLGIAGAAAVIWIFFRKRT
jgi:membrane protein DedA with SNARE-associated domain